jgi:hypothetical protein
MQVDCVFCLISKSVLCWPASRASVVCGTCRSPNSLILSDQEHLRRWYARNIESAHRAALANGLVGIREKKLSPMLADFLKNDFAAFAESKHAAKPLTLRYYQQGANMLTASGLGRLRLDELTSQHAQEFARKYYSAGDVLHDIFKKAQPFYIFQCFASTGQADSSPAQSQAPSLQSHPRFQLDRLHRYQTPICSASFPSDRI